MSIFHDQYLPDSSISSLVSPEQLARTYYGPLTHYFRRRGQQDSAAQDLVQEVFIRLSNRGKQEAIDNIEAYLMQTASNVWKDYLRSQYSRAAKYHVEYEEEIHAVEEIGVERIYGGKNILQKVLELLDKLPVRQRRVIVLSRMEGMTQPEVAKRLNVSTSSVEKDLSKALNYLTLHLQAGKSHESFQKDNS